MECGLCRFSAGSAGPLDEPATPHRPGSSPGSKHATVAERVQS